MLGGKHKYALDPEEYVFASLNLCKSAAYLKREILFVLEQQPF